MKLLKNIVCRKRYRVQIKIRKWANIGGWGWDVGKVDPKKKEGSKREQPEDKKAFK